MKPRLIAPPGVSPFAAAVLVAGIFATGLSANEPDASLAIHKSFAPLAFLSGHCWTGELPNKTIDTHCFERMYDGTFLRDRHFVTGGPELYCGETIYAWDEEKRQVVYWYWASTGNFSVGVVDFHDSDIVFPERVVTADGVKEYRSIWRKSGGGYQSLLTEKEKESWKQIWNIRFEQNNEMTGKYESLCNS